MKKKVEAFEEHALDAQDPAQARQTRTKTRANSAAVNESNSASSSESSAKAKLITPNLADMRNNSKGNHITPNSVNTEAMGRSKLAHLNRAPSSSKIPQNPRESSAEDSKRGQVINTIP